MDQEPLERLHRELETACAERAVSEQEVVVAELTVVEISEVVRVAQREHRVEHAARPLEPVLRLADDEPDFEHLDGVLQPHDARRQLGAATVAEFTHAFVVYESDALPERYRGRLFACNPLLNHVIVSRREPLK